MKLLTLALLTTTLAAPVYAEDLTFVIPGGTKGVFMGQAVSHTEDLSRLGYTTDIAAPGNTCGAAEAVASSDHPTLFVWGSDSAAEAVAGEGCAPPEFVAEDVIAYARNPVFVCVTDPAIDPLDGDRKLGIWQAAETVQTAAVKKLNSVAGSELTPIPYDGSGSVLTALTNGEVEVGFLPRTRAASVVEAGGSCPYVMASTDGDSVGLVEKFNEPALDITAMDVIVAKNWDPVAAQAALTEIYADPTSSVSQNPAKFNDAVPADIVDQWNNAVEAFVVE